MTGNPHKALARAAGGRRTPGAPPSSTARIADLRQKYRALLSKHRLLLEQTSRTMAERTGLHTLALFALASSDAAVAIADRDHVLFRNVRWHRLERDRTAWRAVARDTAAPAAAQSLLHLATAAAHALLARPGPQLAAARYERPDRSDVLDVRFERIPDRSLVGISIRDVTRLVTAEREVSRARRALNDVHARSRSAAPCRSGRGVLPPRS